MQINLAQIPTASAYNSSTARHKRHFDNPKQYKLVNQKQFSGFNSQHASPEKELRCDIMIGKFSPFRTKPVEVLQPMSATATQTANQNRGTLEMARGSTQLEHESLANLAGGAYMPAKRSSIHQNQNAGEISETPTEAQSPMKITSPVM